MVPKLVCFILISYCTRSQSLLRDIRIRHLDLDGKLHLSQHLDHWMCSHLFQLHLKVYLFIFTHQRNNNNRVVASALLRIQNHHHQSHTHQILRPQHHYHYHPPYPAPQPPHTRPTGQSPPSTSTSPQSHQIP